MNPVFAYGGSRHHDKPAPSVPYEEGDPDHEQRVENFYLLGAVLFAVVVFALVVYRAFRWRTEGD